MRSKAAFIVELFLSRHPSDDQISRLRLPLWTSTGETEPIAVMLRHINAGNIGALRAACSDLISDRNTVRDDREIVVSEAATVLRIFQELASDNQVPRTCRLPYSSYSSHEFLHLK
jgi:hypothetical protein